MSIAIQCSGCQVRLTLGDDRAGNQFPCPRCATQISVPAPVPVPTASAKAAPKEPILSFDCPHCSIRLKARLRSSGKRFNCPNCKRSVPVPTSPQQQTQSAPSQQAPPPLPPPVSLDFDPTDPTEDSDEYIPSLRRRREVGWHQLWRGTSLALAGIALVCYFLPWVRYAAVVPAPNAFVAGELGLHQDLRFGNQSGLRMRDGGIEFEFGTQSGMEATFALISLQPALERWAKIEMKQTEVEWRRAGKNPTVEWIKRGKPYMAPWLLVLPLLMLLSGLSAMTSAPTRGACWMIFVSAFAALLVLVVQFGIAGSPAVRAIYDEMAREGGHGAGAALVLSLLLAVRYTPWFWLVVLSLITKCVLQLIALNRGSR